jgi:hypothetical protein
MHIMAVTDLMWTWSGWYLWLNNKQPQTFAIQGKFCNFLTLDPSLNFRMRVLNETNSAHNEGVMLIE